MTWRCRKWPSSCRQHRLDFARRQPGEQRVEQHHPLGGAEAGEIGIGMRGAAAAVHHEEALRREAAACHQGLDPLPDRRIGERLELVEERRDDGGIEHQHHQLQRGPRAPRPKPPEPSGRRHDPQDQRRQRQADDRADERALDRVGEPEAPREPIETEALLDPERRPQTERQLEQAADRDEGHQQRELIGHRTEARQDDGTQLRIERAESAQQRPPEQHGGSVGARQQTEAGLDDRVVGGTSMRIERHRRGERRGDRIAMRHDVPHLPRRQPEPGRERAEQGGGKHQREDRRLHRRRV